MTLKASQCSWVCFKKGSVHACPLSITDVFNYRIVLCMCMNRHVRGWASVWVGKYMCSVTKITVCLCAYSRIRFFSFLSTLWIVHRLCVCGQDTSEQAFMLLLLNPYILFVLNWPVFRFESSNTPWMSFLPEISLLFLKWPKIQKNRNSQKYTQFFVHWNSSWSNLTPIYWNGF